METNWQLAPPERAPDPQPSEQKSRWNVFEIFRKKSKENEKPGIELGVEKPKDSQEAGEASEQLPPRRRFAAEVMHILRGENTPRRSQQQSVEGAGPTHTPETTPALSAAAEIAPEPTIIERAKDMGRSVLRLLGRVSEDVRSADVREQVSVPTDIVPLQEADQDVRAAMQELIAPIIAYEATHTTQTPTEEVLQPEPPIIESVPDAGGDGIAETPLQRVAEVAAVSAAAVTTELFSKEHLTEKRRGTMRKVGMLAMTAATLGGFMYTWHHLREVHHEQKRQYKERLRFENEVRTHQAYEEARLHQLQQMQTEQMSQPQRQQYVHEVSQFAHQQAGEIRAIAQNEKPAVRRPLFEPLQPAQQTTESAPQPVAEFQTFRVPEAHSVQTTEKRPVPTTKKEGIAERMANLVTGNKQLQGGAGQGSGLAHVGLRLLGAITGTPQQPSQNSTSQQPSLRSQPTQAWLKGVALAGSVVLAIVILINVL